LGIGDWAQSPIPHPPSPIPNIIDKYTNKNLITIKIKYYIKK